MQSSGGENANDHVQPFARSLSAEGANIYFDLGWFWTALAGGKYFIVSTLYSESRCFMSVVARSDRSPPQAESVRILERILCGESQKAIAIGLGKAVSTVSLQAGTCIRYLCRDACASRPSMMLALAAHAAHGTLIWGRMTYSEGARTGYTVSAPRSDRWLAGKLPPAELQVVRLLMEERSHAEIAALRKTSERTVANQLACVFRRLEVSGRGELLAMLTRQAEGDPYDPSSDALSPALLPIRPHSESREPVLRSVHGERLVFRQDERG